MVTLSGFNADDHYSPSGYEPIPAGWYVAQIIESTMRPARSGNGRYLQLTFQIVEGTYKGRRLWARLSIEHENSQIRAIALRQLAEICQAVGVPRPADSVELHEKPLVVSVKVKSREGKNYNEIASYKRYEPAPKPTAKTQRQEPFSSPFWKRQ